MTTKKLDAKVKKLMKEVKERRKKVGYLKKPQWLTSCSLQLPGHDRFNIQVCNDPHLLVYFCGMLSRMAEDMKSAAEELEVDIQTTWQRYEIDEWIRDIKLRVRCTQIQAEQRKLDVMEAKLKELTSPEQRRAIALKEIESELG